MAVQARTLSGRPAARPAPASAMPTLLFGIGAPKSGTTWLYEYLRRHPDCYLRGHKELHFFDSIERNAIEARARQLAGWIAEREALFGTVPPGERGLRMAEIMDMRDFLSVLRTCRRDPAAYFRYLLAGKGSQKLVADITPNYGLLSAGMLRRMAASAGSTRFIYLMRDPVARLWSQLRMAAEQTLPEGGDFLAHVGRMLDELLDGGHDAIRRHSDYAATIGRLEEAVPAERRLILFFEDLTTPEGVRRLCRFLGIRPVAAGYTERVLEGREAEATPDQRAAMRRLLEPQYAFAAERFKQVPAAWRAEMAEGFS
jgi:hypothetical protein